MIAEMTLVRMCDEALDTSVDALLSRISKLEYAISVASISSSPITASAPSVPSEVNESPITLDKKASDKRINTAMENTMEPTREESAPSRSTDKPELRPIRCKMEIAEKLAMTDIPSSSFIKSSYIFEDQSGRIIIKLTGDFAVTMLSRPQTKSALSKALSSCLMREITENSILIEVGAGDDAEKYDVLDEFLEN